MLINIFRGQWTFLKGTCLAYLSMYFQFFQIMPYKPLNYYHQKPWPGVARIFFFLLWVVQDKYFINLLKTAWAIAVATHSVARKTCIFENCNFSNLVKIDVLKSYICVFWPKYSSISYPNNLILLFREFINLVMKWMLPYCAIIHQKGPNLP